MNDHVLFTWSFTTSNTEDLTTKNFQPYMFQVVPSTGIEARRPARFFAYRNYKRFFCFGPDYECILTSRMIETADDDVAQLGLQRPMMESGQVKMARV